MTRYLKYVIISLLLATVAYAASNAYEVLGVSTNSSSTWQSLRGGLYFVNIYAPEGTNSDGTCSGGGAWDTASATLEYTPDNGTSIFDVDVANLVGATADVIETIQVGRGVQFRLTVSSVGASTCINLLMAQSQ